MRLLNHSVLQLRSWTQVERQNVYGNSSLLSVHHEQPVHVFTGPSVETHPAWLHALLGMRKNVSHYLAVPTSQHPHF